MVRAGARRANLRSLPPAYDAFEQTGEFGFVLPKSPFKDYIPIQRTALSALSRMIQRRPMARLFLPLRTSLRSYGCCVHMKAATSKQFSGGTSQICCEVPPRCCRGAREGRPCQRRGACEPSAATRADGKLAIISASTMYFKFLCNSTCCCRAATLNSYRRVRPGSRPIQRFCDLRATAISPVARYGAG